MKKILSLVLALALILTAVCALAEGPASKEEDEPSGYVWPSEEELKAIKAHNFGLGYGDSSAAEEVADPEIGITFLKEIPEAAAAAVEALKAANDKGDLTDAAEGVTIPDNFKDKKVVEVLAAQFDGDCANVTKEKVLNLKLGTPFTAGQEVLILIGIIGDDGVEWENPPFVGAGKEDGCVDVTLPSAVFIKLMNIPFLAGVIG